jgi:hypothetical protein
MNDDGNNSNRGQKDVIIRKNSSKLLRPASGKKDDPIGSNSGHYRNKSQVIKKNTANNKVLNQGMDLNYNAGGVGSPSNMMIN